MLDVLLISIALILAFLWLVNDESEKAGAMREEYKERKEDNHE
jgi:hypothetical protein